MTRTFSSGRRERCRSDRPDPFPVHTLTRVDRPTTAINEDLIQRADEREQGFNRAARGDFGPRLAAEYKRLVAKHPLSGALGTMTGVMGRLVEGGAGPGETPTLPPVAAQRAPGTDDPARMALHVKETAYFLRADAVGICELPPYAVYSHARAGGQPVRLDHRYAIAVLVDQDWRTASASDGHDWISNAMSFVAYSTSAFIACQLADYIRRLGYPARAHHARNYQVVVPPILLWAGLGEMSRIGDCVVNPFLGPRFKAAIVTTDLPLAVDQPIDFGLQDFCGKCRKCARACPAHALSDGGKEMHNGYERWPTHVERCTSMRVGNPKGSGCGTCLKVCPWNKPSTLLHRAVNWTVRNVPVARRLAIWGDDLLGYGRANPAQKWWLDLEDVEGTLVARSGRREDGQ